MGDMADAVGTTDRPEAGDRSSLGAILTVAVRLWLQSQVDRAEDLTIAVDGRTRQILSGYLPRVAVSARSTVYQGLHLGTVAVEGGPIRINLKPILAGKPLQLLDAIAVRVQWQATAADLNASLGATLLATALATAIAPLLPENDGDDRDDRRALADATIALEPSGLRLTGTLPDGRSATLETGLVLTAPNALALTAPTWTMATAAGPQRQAPLDDLPLPLGDDVAIETLTLTAGAIACSGRLWVRP